MRGLEGRTALVTGAGRGIGRAIAARLAEEGMAVGVNDVDAAAAASSAREIEVRGGRAIALPANVASEPDARAMVSDMVERLGGLYALVNNAGVDVSGPVSDMTFESWSRVHSVDLWAPLLLVREAESALAQSRGSVVNIGSTHALATVPERSAYAAAKAGLLGLTRALAIELGPRGIRVNAILPGYIETPIWDLWLARSREPQQTLSTIAERHPVRRYGRPEDVAGVVAFVLSSDAEFMTGASLVVDGGYSSLLESPIE